MSVWFSLGWVGFGWSGGALPEVRAGFIAIGCCAGSVRARQCAAAKQVQRAISALQGGRA